MIANIFKEKGKKKKEFWYNFSKASLRYEKQLGFTLTAADCGRRWGWKKEKNWCYTTAWSPGLPPRVVAVRRQGLSPIKQASGRDRCRFFLSVFPPGSQVRFLWQLPSEATFFFPSPFFFFPPCERCCSVFARNTPCGCC